MYSEENRLNLLALHGVADGVSELGEVGDHGAGLFLGTVLPERNKVIVLAVEKKSDVRGISGKRVVGGDGEDDGRFISKMGFGGKGNGRVGNARSPSFAIVFPVQGAMTSASSSAFGPIGSTSGIVCRIS